MAKIKINWDEEFPGGFLSYYATRHMPKDLHDRLHVLASLEKKSVEYMLAYCLQLGIGQREVELFMPEIVESERGGGGEGDSG